MFYVCISSRTRQKARRPSGASRGGPSAACTSRNIAFCSNVTIIQYHIMLSLSLSL